MSALPSVLSLAHFVGLGLAVGAATVKLLLLLKCRGNTGFVSVYIAVARVVTRPIIVGMVLLTLSGIGWLLMGFPWTPLLTVKIVLVAALWAVGPLIDNVVEPRFLRLAPGPGIPASSEFSRAQRRYLVWEVVATSFFYLVVVIWVWR